eukprot:COSAG02_NODE_3069_length_7427_cov_7.977211_5_plen_80_part_00
MPVARRAFYQGAKSSPKNKAEHRKCCTLIVVVAPIHAVLFVLFYCAFLAQEWDLGFLKGTCNLHGTQCDVLHDKVRRWR